MLKIDRFYDARRELRKVLRRTPLIPAPMFSTDAEVYIKPENLQITGSFKVRGAYYKMTRLSEEEKKRGYKIMPISNRRFLGVDGEELSEISQFSHKAILNDYIKQNNPFIISINFRDYKFIIYT